MKISAKKKGIWRIGYAFNESSRRIEEGETA
jgi:hypothetical protein